MKLNGIKHISSVPYHTASNGAVERLVCTFKQAMKAGDKDGLSHQHQLENVLLTYRSTPHVTIPCTLFLGRSVRTRLDLLHQMFPESNQALQKQQYDRHSCERKFTSGERVMVRNYRQGPAWTQGTVFLVHINAWTDMEASDQETGH
jgi:hypothetical protein